MWQRYPKEAEGLFDKGNFTLYIAVVVVVVVVIVIVVVVK